MLTRVFRSILILIAVVILLAGTPRHVAAQIEATVSTEGELVAAILAANAAPPGSANSISLLDDITLTRSLPMISNNIAFAGNGFMIDADNSGRVFFVHAGVVSISNVTVANALALGGAGGNGTSMNQPEAAGAPGGGGGLGAGAALFVNTGAAVTVTNVTVSGAQATGGAAVPAELIDPEIEGDVSGSGAGGGGIGGPGGSAATGDTGNVGGGAGGGGYHGIGGGSDGTSGGAGGGGGQFGAGGYGFSSGGGGGGGTIDDGQDNATGLPTPGGGAEGGTGAATGAQGGEGAAVGGGGGGGGANGIGGGGNIGGGGGGGGAGASGASGGDFGGGGGGGTGGSGGAGGFGGGGGSGGFIGPTVLGDGGAGGFGAGGGGGVNGGAGGAFGGQGGSGTSADGGGGAALGGAVFVRAGGVLIVTESAFSGTDVTAGTTGGVGGATAGQTQGRLAFVMGGAGGVGGGHLTLGVSAGIVTIDDDDALAGAGTLVKAGDGVLVLDGANVNFAGSFDITGGAVRFGVGGSLSPQTALSVINGTLDVNSTNQTIGSLAGSGAVQLGSGTLATGALNTSTTFSGVMSGTGSLTKFGAGALTLGGVNTYTGSTTVAGGTLRFVTGGSVSGQTAVSVLSGATLDLNSTTQTVGSLDGGGNVVLGTGALTVGGNNSTTFFSGAVSGSGALTKVGTGTMTLAGANSYTGATTVAAGTLRFDVGGSLSGLTAVDVLSGATLDLNNTTQAIGSLAGAGNVLIGTGALSAGSNDGSTIFTGSIAGSGGFTKVGTGTLALGGVNTFTGPTLITGGILQLSGGSLSSATDMSVAAGATFDLNGATQAIASLSGGGTVLLGSGVLVTGSSNASTLFSGTIGGTGSFVKAGTGTMTLGGANTYTGLTAIAQGRLQLAGGGLSSLTTVAIAGGATWDLNGAVQAIDGLVGAGGVWLGGGTLTVGSHGASSAFGGVVSGPGSLVKAGPGMLALLGANAHTGGTFLSGGTLLVGSDANLGAPQSGLFFDGGTLLVGANLTSNRNVTLTGPGGIDTSGFQVRWDGLVSGPGTLIKSGPGVLSLTNTNSYTGGTQIVQGTLIGTSASVRGDVVNDALLNFDQSFDGVHVGNIRGSGALLKSGGGQLTLVGTNTYTGGTVIAAGTLAGTSDSLRGDILNDARLVFDQTFGGTFDGTLYGMGTTIKTGVGTVNLTGTHPFSGSTVVSQGALGLDGVLGGNLRVDAGATLVGSGALLGSLTLAGRLEVPATAAPLSSATLSPAAHLGHGPAAEPLAPRLMIGGTLTGAPGSVIRLNLSPGGAAPIGVEGSTILSHTNFEVAFAEVPGRSTTYTALTAQGGLRASDVTTRSVDPNLVPILTEDGTSILVTLLNLAVPVASAGTTQNTASVGRAVDAIKHDATGDLARVVHELIALDDEGLDLALEGLGGQLHASQHWMAVLDSEAFTDMVRQEITMREHAYDEDLANPAFATRAQQLRWWAQLSGERASFEGVGFRGAVANLGGVGGGFDLKRTNRWVFGVGGSFSAAGLSLNGLGGGSDLTAPRAFAYSGVRLGRFRLNAGGSTARTSYQTSRRITFAATVPTATGDVVLFDEGIDREATSEQLGWASDAWSDWQDSIKIKSWTLDSKIGWRHVRVSRESWIEQGAGSISLEAPAQTLKLTEGDAGVHLFKRTGGIRPRALFHYKRQLFEEGSEVAMQFVDQPDGRFTTSGLPTGKDTITALGGVTFITESGLEYAVRYEVRHATGELRQKVAFRVRFR